MSLDTTTDERPITDVAQLIAYFRSAERPDSAGLVGLEHEKLLFPLSGDAPVPYAGGVESVLAAFEKRGWDPFRESPTSPVIALMKGKATISLEPGGQFEFSGTPFSTAREAAAENTNHLIELREVLTSLGLRAVTLGYRPFHALTDMPWMPKTRYVLMRNTLGARGSHAHNMMLMTATGQVSLDWKSEEDCARKVMASAKISPVLVALFANSPIVEGRDAGLQSFRSRVWNDVDTARCGYPESMLDGSFSYAKYVEWALDAPMLFLRRRGQYVNPARTFRLLMTDGFEGEPATFADWIDHLSTLFPEVRIKRVLEIRAADCNNAAMTGALAAIMRGLLYDDGALNDIETLLPQLSPAKHRELHREAQKSGLNAMVGGRSLREQAVTVVAIAKRALMKIDRLDAPLLEPLEAILSEGKTPADHVLEAFKKSGPAMLKNFEI